MHPDQFFDLLFILGQGEFSLASCRSCKAWIMDKLIILPTVLIAKECTASPWHKARSRVCWSSTYHGNVAVVDEARLLECFVVFPGFWGLQVGWAEQLYTHELTSLKEQPGSMKRKHGISLLHSTLPPSIIAAKYVATLSFFYLTSS